MPHRFDLATLQAVDIANCAPGFYWQLSHLGGPANAILKLDSETPQYLFFVQLSGERMFHAVFGQMPRPGSFVLLPVGNGPVKLELPNSLQQSNNRETLGAISICAEGAYLTVIRVDQHGLSETQYVSLQNFTIDEHLPSQKFGVFTTWRLTTGEENPSERTVLLANGEWPQE